MTVEIKPQVKSGSCLEGAAPKAVDLRDILDVDPLQQGQALLAANKKRKKQQKRAGNSLKNVQCLLQFVVSPYGVMPLFILLFAKPWATLILIYCFILTSLLLFFADKIAVKLSDTLTSAMNTFWDSWYNDQRT